MKIQVNPVIFWTPRILCILFIFFLALFALDVFEEGRGFLGTALALFMHLIPNFVLILILILSWKWEWIGGILFNAVGIFYIAAFDNVDINAYVFISGPLFLTGSLFLIGWFSKRKTASSAAV